MRAPSSGLPVDTALKSPGASAVIYGGVDAEGVVFDGVDEALRVPRTDVRLFGKPESFVKRRMGVALAYDEDLDTARRNAVEAARRVRPRESSSGRLRPAGPLTRRPVLEPQAATVSRACSWRRCRSIVAK